MIGGINVGVEEHKDPMLQQLRIAYNMLHGRVPKLDVVDVEGTQVVVPIFVEDKRLQDALERYKDIIQLI